MNVTYVSAGFHSEVEVPWDPLPPEFWKVIVHTISKVEVWLSTAVFPIHSKNSCMTP